jgi:putative two-component system response regulator
MNSTANNTVPCQKELAASSIEASSADELSKILLIDDEPVNTALLEAILADNGYVNIGSINDSRIALQTCNSLSPDLILLDLMMPYFDGIAILRALRSEPDKARLPVMVLTADETESTRLRALDAGATDFMLKPFDLTELLLRIKNLLALTAAPNAATA